MDIEEKRKKVNEFCRITNCDKCPLLGQTWDHYLHNTRPSCLHISSATEEELDRALNLFEEYYNNRPVNMRFMSYEEHKENTLGKIRESIVPDPIKPEYYNDTKITPFDVIDDWGLNFYLGNAVKYIKRAGKKAGNSKLQDLKKIREYIDHEIRAEGER